MNAAIVHADIFSFTHKGLHRGCCLDPIPHKGGIKVRRLIAATSDLYREHLFGMAV
jgi:hypothetical protein